MSIGLGHPEPQCVQAKAQRILPGDCEFQGGETVEHFLREILRQEKRLAKRQRLPELAPCDPEDQAAGLLGRLGKKLFRA